MRTHTWTWPLVLVGCFSPNESGSDEEGLGTSSSAASTTSEVSTDTTSGSSTDPPDQGSSSSTTSSTTPSTTSSAGQDPSSSSGVPPFCGDTVIDPGEECDDGVRNNALDARCLPDCNLNVCGDANVGPDEGCDEGSDDNAFELGACAPDCSRVIEEKQIVLSGTIDSGYLLPNPVGLADGLCPPGYRALFAVPGVRQATNGTPRTVDAPIDWPLRSYTAYVNEAGESLWMTDDVALLGVREGAAQTLDNPFIFVPNCQTRGVLTGLNDDWTNALDNTCDGWSTPSSDVNASVGQPCVADSFLDDSNHSCASLTPLTFFYCVEQ